MALTRDEGFLPWPMASAITRHRATAPRSLLWLGGPRAPRRALAGQLHVSMLHPRVLFLPALLLPLLFLALYFCPGVKSRGRGCRQKGDAAPSSPQRHADGSSPAEPSFSKDQHLFTHINSTHARLNLQGWSSGGCPITAIVLEYRPKGNWGWQSLRTNSSGELFLTELREATWYELRMKACNSAGCGNESTQFATLDYDGSEWGAGPGAVLPGGDTPGVLAAHPPPFQAPSRPSSRPKGRGMM